MEKIIRIRRSGELSKEMCIRGFREQFHLEEEISDEEVLACFKALYDQPLMVNMATAEGGTFEYAILKSKSLGFLLSNRDNQEFWDSLSDEVQEDLGQFYKLVPEDNVIFPYIHTTNSVAADVYYSDTIYICGMYTSGMYLSGRDGWNQNFETGGCLVLPSLADMTLLRWADMLYDTILSNNHSEGYQEAAL